ncbi:MAG: acylphosphatase [Candidatus Dependentiae bacterium]|nr:acylphosphatase [Candidatus Dependentiae bacterium]
MNKCLKIVFGIPIAKDFIHSVIQKSAKKCSLEGTAQIVITENKVKVIVCGPKESVDQFIDLLHKESKAYLEDLEIEPFLKDRDYRGVFRVIE